MLYHVTATHTADNRPLYNPDLWPACGEAMQKLEAPAKEHNVKLHFSVSGAPDHVFFHLLALTGNLTYRRMRESKSV